MKVYRIEQPDGSGPYVSGTSEELQENLRHDLTGIHPVEFPRGWVDDNKKFRYGFTDWNQACEWWGHWGKEGISLLENIMLSERSRRHPSSLQGCDAERISCVHRSITQSPCHFRGASAPLFYSKIILDTSGVGLYYIPTLNGTGLSQCTSN